MQVNLSNLGIRMTAPDDSEDQSQLRRALVKGLFHNTARRQPDGRYRLYSTSQVWSAAGLFCGCTCFHTGSMVTHIVLLT